MSDPISKKSSYGKRRGEPPVNVGANGRSVNVGANGCSPLLRGNISNQSWSEILPKISVCMAVFNGERYLKQQLQSILSQLRKYDEIVIVDDASTDTSLQLIYNLQDSRIRVIQNLENQGVISSFATALQNSEGDVIFLSDQDDIWLPKKVQKILEVFQKQSDITLVTSDAQLINEEGEIIAPSFFSLRGQFIDHLLPNLMKNKYHGCTLAFRKELLKKVLPFPDDIPMHDSWIGLVNHLYGETIYLEEPLLQYRIHNYNTGRGISDHAGLLQMIQWRIIFIKNLLKRRFID